MGLTMKTERPIEDAIQIVEHYISHALEVEECECETCDTAYEAWTQLSDILKKEE